MSKFTRGTSCKVIALRSFRTRMTAAFATLLSTSHAQHHLTRLPRLSVLWAFGAGHGRLEPARTDHRPSTWAHEELSQCA